MGMVVVPMLMPIEQPLNLLKNLMHSKAAHPVEQFGDPLE
jgi:hypothetical protein